MPAQLVTTRLRVGSGGLLYIVVASLLLAAAFLTQNNLLFWSFGLMVGGLGVSIVIAWYSMRGLVIERLTPQHAVAGETMVLRYQIHNTKRFMPLFNLVIQEAWNTGSWRRRETTPLTEARPRLTGAPLGWAVHVGPRQVVQAEAVCWPRRRGELPFERIEVSTTFPFGVIRRVCVYEQRDKVLIYPPLYRVGRHLWYRLTQLDPAGHLQVDRAGGTEEFFGLRRYRPGDSLRSIDWRHSAKTGQMICRELTQPSPPRLVMLLTLASGHSQNETRAAAKRTFRWSYFKTPAPTRPHPAGLDDANERAIALAASVICGAHLQGFQVGMVVTGLPGLTFRVHHSLPHRARLLEALSLLDAQEIKAGAPMPALEPTVAVRAGEGADKFGTGGLAGKCLLLDADHLETHLHPAQTDSSQLLARGIAPRSKRQQSSGGPAMSNATIGATRGGDQWA